LLFIIKTLSFAVFLPYYSAKGQKKSRPETVCFLFKTFQWKRHFFHSINPLHSCRADKPAAASMLTAQKEKVKP